MRAHVAIHLEQWFLDYVRPFINGNVESEVLRIKRDHCRRVAEDMTGIARDLGLAEDDIQTARLLGWMHDVGRFPQYARYQTPARRPLRQSWRARLAGSGWRPGTGDVRAGGPGHPPDGNALA